MRLPPVAIPLSLASAVVVGAFALTLPSAPANHSTVSSAVGDLSADRYLQHVTYLASDAMAGRANGSDALNTASEYIASRFSGWGLQPGGEGGTFFQTFELTTGAAFGPNNQLSLNGAPATVDTDFVPISFSNTAVVDGPVAFVGYGITAPELMYDDYRDADVTGKVVIAFRHEPQELDPKSPFDGTNATRHASFINKAINAKQHGAAAIVFVTDPNNHASEADDVGPATRGAETDDVGIPSVHVRRDLVGAMFKANGRDLAALQRTIDAALAPQSFTLPAARIRIASDVRRTRAQVRNVIAALPGRDPALRDEWVVVGAHYDHLGLGERGSMAPSQRGQIHHGADDNASGTSGVLELARVAAARRQGFGRSVLFTTFAGEELGLLGSAYLANHPPVAIDAMAAMINMDMIGRPRNGRIFVGGVGTSPAFKPALDEVNRRVGLQLDFSDSGFGSSDHTSFTVKHVPVLFFFSGLHGDYHKPSDTADKIDAQGARQVLSLVSLMLERLATDPVRPEWTAVAEEAPAGGGGTGYGPYFGSIPDFGAADGVLFAEVRPGSPAAKAGLQAGDLLVEFDGKAIQNLYDFTYALRAKKPGDTVRVVVRRGDVPVAATVLLEARR